MDDYQETFDELFGPERQQDERNRRRQARDMARLREAYAAVLNSPDGREVLFDLLNQCGLFRDSFTGNSQTFYNEGRRAAGLYVFKNLCQVNPLAMQILVNHQAEKTRQQETQNA
jgi:hypothetical protein